MTLMPTIPITQHTQAVFQDPLPADLSVYIHIPFCQKRCIYCDFATFTGREDDIPAYLAALQQEISWRVQPQGQEKEWPPVATVFFGGGTPSLLSATQVRGILDHLRDLFVLRSDAEVTLEANPGTIDRDGEALCALRDAGVTRLSFGVQTLDDQMLVLIGRIHSADEARQAIRNARSAGFTEFNGDLIYGLPGQTLEAWEQSLRGMLAEDLPHISLYALTPERGTPLYRALGRGELTVPVSDVVADMYELARAVLAEHGYCQYEISNWAKPDHESRHNTTYWRHTPYFGFGVSAHGYIDGYRVANLRGIDGYLKRIAAGRDPALRREPIDLQRARSDALILGLRLTVGVDLAEYTSRFGTDPREVWGQEIARLIEQGLLEITADGRRLRMTPQSYLIGNYVWQHFL